MRFSLGIYKPLFEIAKIKNSNLSEELTDKNNIIFLLQQELKERNLENQQLDEELQETKRILDVSRDRFNAAMRTQDAQINEANRKLFLYEKFMKILRTDILSACKTSGPRAFRKFDAYLRSAGI